MVDDNEFMKRRHLSRGRPRKYEPGNTANGSPGAGNNGAPGGAGGGNGNGGSGGGDSRSSARDSKIPSSIGTGGFSLPPLPPPPALTLPPVITTSGESGLAAEPITSVNGRNNQ